MATWLMEIGWNWHLKLLKRTWFPSISIPEDPQDFFQGGPKLIRVLLWWWSTKLTINLHQNMKINYNYPVRLLGIPWAPNAAVYLLRSFGYLWGFSRKRRERPYFGVSWTDRVLESLESKSPTTSRNLP
jgi:hypothetical protein